MISVRNIVKVNLDILNSEEILGDLQTTVYFAPVTLVNEDAQSVNQLLIKDPKLIDVLMSGNDAAKISAQNYFANGGRKLLVINPTLYTVEAFADDLKAAREITKDFLYVAISNQIIGETGYTLEEFEKIATYCDKTESPEKARLLITTNSATYLEDNNLIDHLLVAKYSTKTGGSNAKLIDAALLVGAYFSQINLDGTETIKDYNFTAEKLQDIADDKDYEDLTQAEFDALVKNENDNGYYNVIDRVGNKVVNLGGNLATIENISIHTDFGAAAVERDITYSVLERMLGKQYLTEQGISNIKAAINSQLQRYKTNGYLNVGAQYSGDDLVIEYNNVKYNVIKNGAALPQGFYIFSVPMNNLSVADRQARKFTPIYVILETQDGARVVEITGEVR